MVHRLFLPLLALLPLACGPTAPASSTPVLEIAPAGSASPTLKPVAKTESPPADNSNHYLFGLLGQSGTAHCPEPHGKRHWRNVKPVVGFVPIGGADTTAIAQLMGQPVIATGKAGTPPKLPPFDPTGDQFSCPPFQARSDWRMTPRGLRLVREPRPTMGFFRVDALRQMTALRVKQNNDKITASFTNPLPFAIKEVKLRMYYEGCFGKPGVTQKTIEKTTLGPGQTIEMHESAILTLQGRRGPRRSTYRAFSVQLVATSDRATFDLDVPLSVMKAETNCPRRP